MVTAPLQGGVCVLQLGRLSCPAWGLCTSVSETLVQFTRTHSVVGNHDGFVLCQFGCTALPLPEHPRC